MNDDRDMEPDDDDSSWGRQLAIGLGALVTISLLVGGIVGALALGAAKLSGIESAGGGPVAKPSLYIPTGEPSTTPESYPDPTAPETSPTAEPSESPEPSPNKPSRRISLQVFPNEVSPGERINFSGVYPAGEGATLQVQRFEGSWSDFPVTANVRGGIFTTYIVTSRTGKAKFRVLDLGSGRASNAVTVTIR